MSESGRASRRAATRIELVEAAYRKVGLSRSESARLVELVLREISDCLERGETVKLSAFGSFMVRAKGPRMGRNPKTGVDVPITPRRVMVFKPSDTLRKAPRHWRRNGRLARLWFRNAQSSIHV
jgi:integration host factor subunit alpha